METPPDSQKKTPSPFLILYVVASVQFLTPFMMSATGVALPAIGREFNAGAVHLGLIEMVYILAVTLLLLAVRPVCGYSRPQKNVHHRGIHHDRGHPVSGHEHEHPVFYCAPVFSGGGCCHDHRHQHGHHYLGHPPPQAGPGHGHHYCLRLHGPFRRPDPCRNHDHQFWLALDFLCRRPPGTGRLAPDGGQTERGVGRCPGSKV